MYKHCHSLCVISCYIAMCTCRYKRWKGPTDPHWLASWSVSGFFLSYKYMWFHVFRSTWLPPGDVLKPMWLNRPEAVWNWHKPWRSISESLIIWEGCVTFTQPISSIYHSVSIFHGFCAFPLGTAPAVPVTIIPHHASEISLSSALNTNQINE